MSIFLPHPGPTRLGDFLREQLRSEHWSAFDAAVAFAKASGVRQIETDLVAFSRRAIVRLSVGVDLGGTSREGLESLLRSVEGDGGIWVFHNETHSTFHPKVYMFSNADNAILVVGSGNLTAGGLYTNYEASLATALDLSQDGARDVFESARDALSSWRDETTGAARRLTREFLLELLAEGYIVPERLARPDAASEPDEEADHEADEHDQPHRRRLFATLPMAGVPAVRTAEPTAGGERQPRRIRDGGVAQTTLFAPAANAGYLMTLQTTDVGYGQTTPGTQQRSAEVFIPLEARDYDTDFWGWDQLYTPDPGRPDKRDRQVTIRLGTGDTTATLYNWPPKHDFRIRNGDLRRAANVGDILRLERADPSAAYDFYAEVVPQGTTLHSTYLALCTHSVRNSRKRWGYY